MNAIPKETDTVMIGGGLAGSTTANMLAQRSYDVLLGAVEYPRNTVGESVLSHVWRYLDVAKATDGVGSRLTLCL